MRTPPRWMDAFMTAAHWTWRNRYAVLLVASCIVAGFLFVMAAINHK